MEKVKGKGGKKKSAGKFYSHDTKDVPLRAPKKKNRRKKRSWGFWQVLHEPFLRCLFRPRKGSRGTKLGGDLLVRAGKIILAKPKTRGA